MPCRYGLLLCLSLLSASCTSIGPPTVRRDRLDYADALADAAKRETLLNIVKLRYADTPSLVTVSQLVAGYTLEGRVDLGTDFFTSDLDFADDVNVGVGGTFSDRPTVTYKPIKGDDFARVMLTPGKARCARRVAESRGQRARAASLRLVRRRGIPGHLVLDR